MPNDKLEKLNKMLGLLANDTITPAEIEKFLASVLAFITNSKQGFDQLSADNLQKIDDALQRIQSIHSDTLTEVDTKNSELSSKIDSKISELQQAIDEVKAIEVVNGEDGQDADEEKIVADVLAQLPKPEPVILDTPEDIANKLETLAGDNRLDASAIKNLPVTKGSAGSGLRNVFHDTTLTGTGTAVDPLKVVSGGGAGTVTSVASADGSVTVTNGTTTADLAVVKAPKLTTARTISISGDLTYTSPSFDGSGNVTAAGTLATVNSNVGSFTNANITVNAKGLITAASNGTGGSGGISRSINSISGNTSAGATAATDYVYIVTATATLTLPTAVGNTNQYTVKVTAGTTTIATTSAQTIDGSASAVLSVANTSLTLISDNANWKII